MLQDRTPSVRDLSATDREIAMRYVSTRDETRSTKSFKEVLLAGLAPRGGLYVPETYPQLNLAALRGKSYAEVASLVMDLFVDPSDQFTPLIGNTYTKKIFGTEAIAPVTQICPEVYKLEVSNGPTASFKDMSLQYLGPLMEYVLAKKGEKRNIVLATSGDTGSAAGEALKSRKGLALFVLFPKKGMSEFQRRQMTTLNEPNIFPIEVNGNFDALQDVVKQINNDQAFKEKNHISALNSINWARVMAQVVYYFWACLQVTKKDTDEVVFSVPSGNFGDALAAYVAMRMGAPIRRIIIATNENDVLVECFTKGICRKREKEVNTSSPSMDINIPSNYERYVFDFVGRNSAVIRDLWKQLDTKGSFSLGALLMRPDPEGYFSRIVAGSAHQHEVLRCIQKTYCHHDVLIDPHTAVGLYVGMRYRIQGLPLVVVETALPVKFGDTIYEAIGKTPDIPSRYERLGELPDHRQGVVYLDRGGRPGAGFDGHCALCRSVQRSGCHRYDDFGDGRHLSLYVRHHGSFAGDHRTVD